MSTKSEAFDADLHMMWYLGAMEHLVGVVQQLSQAHDINAVTSIVRSAARSLTGADGATFVLRDGDQCYYAEEDAIAPLWKGKRFPLEDCISGWVMLNAQPAIIPDIYNDPRIPVAAYQPTFVKSLAMVPVRREAPIAAIGNYWKTEHLPTPQEMAILQALADTTSVALKNAELYGTLQKQLHTLQKQQKRISEQHDMLEVFTRAMAHDLKEPVRTIVSFAQLIEKKAVSAEKQQSYFQFIVQAADRMAMLVDSVFQYTQLDDPTPKSKELCALEKTMEDVKQNLALLIRERGTVIRHGQLPNIQANAIQMMQVLQNLIANAINHNEQEVAIHVEAQERDDDWLVSVSDNGSGVPIEFSQKIFLPFKRLSANDEHAGLGLATCHKIITSHGGKIWCEPKQEGATFSFVLPKQEAAKQ